MALSKTITTPRQDSGNYIRVVEALYLADGDKFLVKVGLYRDADTRHIPGAAPMWEFDTVFDVHYDLASGSNAIEQAYVQLKAGFSQFEGAEDC